jgi:predicted RNA-binding Zn ribbon-like protein
VSGSAALDRSTHDARVFELVGGHPTLDLINTLDWRFRDGTPEELLETYGDLLRFCEQSGLLTPSQTRRLLRTRDESTTARVLSRIKELREAAAAVFYAMLDGSDPAGAPIKLLERHFKSAGERQGLIWSESRLMWEILSTTNPHEMPWWLLSLKTADLMTSGEMLRVKACEKPDCRWLFLDTSKNHTRRWCDMRLCGNRMKARRFKTQHRA